jgi:hypothetical protein
MKTLQISMIKKSIKSPSKSSTKLKLFRTKKAIKQPQLALSKSLTPIRIKSNNKKKNERKKPFSQIELLLQEHHSLILNKILFHLLCNKVLKKEEAKNVLFSLVSFYSVLQL